MAVIDTPFKDAQGLDSVPKKGSKGGEYDAAVAPDVPGRDKGGEALSELIFDTAASSKSPSTSGPYKTLFKDAVK